MSGVGKSGTDNNKKSKKHKMANELAARMEKEFREHPDQYHPVDVKRVRDDSWQTERFLQKADHSLSKAFEYLCTTLRWKKSMSVHDRRDEDFPREFYQIVAIEILGRDDDGTLVMWTTSKYTKDLSEFRSYVEPFSAYQLERLDQMAGRNGAKMISDNRHGTFWNTDVSMCKFNSAILDNHYPGMLHQTVLFNLTGALEPVIRMVMAFMSERTKKTVKICKSNEVIQYVNRRFVPVEYGGERQGRTVWVPAKAPGYKEVLTSLTPQQMKRIDDFFAKIKLSEDNETSGTDSKKSGRQEKKTKINIVFES